jgi:hypothetical protein
MKRPSDNASSIWARQHTAVDLALYGPAESSPFTVIASGGSGFDWDRACSQQLSSEVIN